MSPLRRANPGSRPPRSVAVIGAGAAGTLSAIELVRAASRRGATLRVLLIGDHDHGPGVAYSTPDPRHRLNVPTAGMSALADEEDHFLGWSRSQGFDSEPYEFAPRERYGRYLRELLAQARLRAGPDVLIESIDARAVDLTGHGVTLADGSVLSCDAAVLALGNAGPGVPPHIDRHDRLIADPWAGGALDRIDDPERVLLLGTGLTMVDVALTLAARWPEAQLDAVSRSGIVPRAHMPEPGEPFEPAIAPAGELTLDAVLSAVGDAVARSPERWRDVVDGLRPVTQDIWRALSLAERRRFLSDHARTWEAHRHRLAPAVAEQLESLRAEGRLSCARGEVAGVSGNAVEIATPSGGERRRFSWVVNCTGPQQDVERVSDPLVQALLASGRARAHPLGLGFDVDDDGALLGPRGHDRRLLAVGSLRRGALWETTAIPEIRDQAARVADGLLGDGEAPGRPAWPVVEPRESTAA